MLPETIVPRIHVPETLDVLRDFRINPIIICQYAVGIVHQLLKNAPDPFHMGLETIVIHSLQVRFHICRNRFYRLFYVLKIIVQVFLACFA